MEEGLGLWGRVLATAGASWDRVTTAWAAAVRARAVAPALEAAVWLCLATSVMLALEVCYMSIVSFVSVKLLRRVPERRYRWEPMPVLPGSGKDEEAAAGGGEAYYPMVLVQIPMYNEREASAHANEEKRWVLSYAHHLLDALCKRQTCPGPWVPSCGVWNEERTELLQLGVGTWMQFVMMSSCANC